MNDSIKIPENVELILNQLNLFGFEAYIVGGCVRDSIMQKKPKDWDICTSALPEQVMGVFKDYKIIPTGLKHGTITIIINNEQYEITTYRIDGEYEDNRHPKEVKFTTSLEQDLSRRDFTINAMAYNPKTGLIDIFGGRKDIEKQIIRCVGNAEQRFEEDALRILRAMRFAIRYNFIIDLDTITAMNKCKHLLTNISIERINSELTQMLSCDGKNICFTFGYTMDILKVIVPEISFVLSGQWLFRFVDTNGINTRLALFFDLHNPEKVLQRLRFDNKTISNVSNIRKYGQAIFWQSENFINIRYYAKWLLNKIGFKNAINAINYAKAYVKTTNASGKQYDNIELLRLTIGDVCLNEECYELHTMEINGRDVIAAGFKGEVVGTILNTLLEMVMRGEVSNTREELLKKLGDMKNEM